MLPALQVTAIFWLIYLSSDCSAAYELQDTIHTLKEENLHLHNRLENLTRAVRDLKHLLTEHPKGSGEKHDPEFLHAWREWSQHGLSAETHQILEQALCFTELHGAAQPIFTPSFLIRSSFTSMILLLLP